MKTQICGWQGVGKTPVVLWEVLVGADKGFCLSWGLPGRSERLCSRFLQPRPPPPPSPQDRGRSNASRALSSPSPTLLFPGQARRKAGLDWPPPRPRARPSCVVHLVGLPWRGEARPAPTHGNFSQGVSHSGAQPFVIQSKADAPTPTSRALTPMFSCPLT